MLFYMRLYSTTYYAYEGFSYKSLAIRDPRDVWGMANSESLSCVCGGIGPSPGHFLKHVLGTAPTLQQSILRVPVEVLQPQNDRVKKYGSGKASENETFKTPSKP